MISAQFFTTVNFKIFLDTLKLLTFKLPYLRFGQEVDRLEIELKQYLNAEHSQIYSFYNWRSALYHWLTNLPNLTDLTNWTNEVLVSGYTCVSVINTIIQAWYKPVYVDIDESLNMQIEDAEKKVSSNTKAIIVQHTFWNPANMQAWTEFVEKHNLVLIEDCAHALWAEIGWKKVGTFGDMAIFSTWRDKVISSVTWWFLLINNPDLKVKKPKLIPVSRKLALQNLNYNLIAYLAWKTYNIKIWKVLMYIANKFKLIPPILTPNEKACRFNNFFYQLPNSLAYLARRQLRQVDKINVHRVQIANQYKEKLAWKYEFPKEESFAKNIYFGFPIFFDNEENLKKKVIEAKKHWVYLGTYWTGQNIVPVGSNLENCLYQKWTCPKAEDLAKRVLILPNHFQFDKVDKIVDLLK